MEKQSGAKGRRLFVRAIAEIIDAWSGQLVVGIVADFVDHSVTPGLRLPLRSSQPRVAAQSMQMQVPLPSTTTGAR